MFGMYCPRSSRIEPDVGSPVLERRGRLPDVFKRECKVVMSIGIGGRQLDRGLVGRNRFLHSAGFVEHVAEIEISQRVPRINLDRRAIELLGGRVFLAVVIKSPKIDVSGGGTRVHI